jgi:hypothetical protein
MIKVGADQQALFETNKAPTGRRVQGGVVTTDAVLSARVGGNSEAMLDVLALHVPRGAAIADVTYGKGIFWQLVEPGAYNLLLSDLDAKVHRDLRHNAPVTTGVDCRALPYEGDSLDALVLDPPYMEGLHRPSTSHLAGSGTHAAFREHYSNGSATEWEEGAPRWHDAVVRLYVDAGREAYRVLRAGGVFIVKCQDEVSANTQRLTHVELVTAYETFGFYVLPGVSESSQAGVERRQAFSLTSSPVAVSSTTGWGFPAARSATSSSRTLKTLSDR